MQREGLVRVNPTAGIYRHSAWFFLLIPAFAAWGFWPSYFSPGDAPVSVYDHVHGLAMFAWTLMLISQAMLVRSGRRQLHRNLGQFSYVLVPLIAASTVVLANYKIGIRGVTPVAEYILILQLLLLLMFLVFYGLAIRSRRRPDVHARYMICTALPLIDPIFARILFQHLPPTGSPVGHQLLTFLLTDLVLLALIVRDWRSGARRDVFLPMLPLVLGLQGALFLLAGTPVATALATWFRGLPLS